MILNNNKQKAFTIVELLIVIVVIGILAAISIVSYNGIQNRARDTSVKSSASQVRTKIESWNSIKGAYPSAGDLAGGLNDPGAPEAMLDAAIEPMLSTAAAPPQAHSTNGAGTVRAVPCGTTGYDIDYYQSSGTVKTDLGTGCPANYVTSRTITIFKRSHTKAAFIV